MIIDASDRAFEDPLRADVAVVGAGPAGIVVALELEAAGFSVLLIESGGVDDDPQAQALGDAVLDSGGKHAPMSLTTRRGVGGASAVWGGRCVPFDPVDFEHRETVDGRWPITYEDVVPTFERASEWFKCGRPAFDQATMSHLPAGIVPGFRDGDVLSSTFERWSLPTNFGNVYRQKLADSTGVRVVTGLTCTQVVPDEGGAAVASLVTVDRLRRQVAVIADQYVIAAGGLETTRLLLASPGPDGRALGDHSGHLGRWYMAHVEGVVANIRFATPPDQTIYGYEKDIDGVWVRRRLSFSRDTLVRLGLPNIVAWVTNPDPADASHRSGPLSLAYLVLASPLGRFLSPPAQRLALTGHEVPGVPYGPVERSGVLAHLVNVLRQPAATVRWALSFGAGRFLVRGRKAPGFFVQRPSNCYPLMFHGEHLPAYDSRVVMDESTDQLGMGRLRIQIRFTEEDVQGVVRAHEALDRFLREEGIGQLEYLGDDVAAAVRRRIGGGFHQAGTTRMSADPADGVVDGNLAVHGYSNLYVASSSVFVTSGQANSTFMIVALAVRLADRLRTKLGRISAVETD